MKKTIFILILVLILVGLVYLGRVVYFLNYEKFNPGIDISQLNESQKLAVEKCKKINDILLSVESLPLDIGEYIITLKSPDMYNDLRFIGLGMVPIRYKVKRCRTYTLEQEEKRELVKSKISPILAGLYSQINPAKNFKNYLKVANIDYSDEELKQLYRYQDGVPFLKVLLKVRDT